MLVVSHSPTDVRSDGTKDSTPQPKSPSGYGHTTAAPHAGHNSSEAELAVYVSLLEYILHIFGPVSLTLTLRTERDRNEKYSFFQDRYAVQIRTVARPGG